MRSGKTVHAHFVFNSEEHDMLCKKAKLCGLSKSAYMRRLVMDRPVKARPSEAIHDLYVEINRIGTNINQLARKSNAEIIDPDSASAQALLLLKKVYALMDGMAAGV